ncbi:MAG: type VI secretion system baseplate subunit TssK [Deltaproteobacteria bacterium]|jgi:type VI secretion system protein ImpJ|nr:type VI secretion system baseplate subunit TssK [Deltaproteobacteria bacterium]
MIFSRVIFWREGMPLEPHHFQMMEILGRSEREAALQGLFSWPWGFASLSFDGDALEEGVLEIAEMDLALPGGIRLSVPGNAAVAPARIPPPGGGEAGGGEAPGPGAGTGEGDAGDGTVTACIAVPLFSHVGPNVRDRPWEVSGEEAAGLREAEACQEGEPPRRPRGGEAEAAGAAPSGSGRGRAGEGFPAVGRGEGSRSPGGGPQAVQEGPPEVGTLMASRTEPSPVTDMLAGGHISWLDTLAYRPGLVFGGRDADVRGSAVVPVARLRRGGRGFVLVPFAPPAVKLYPDGLLRDTALEVLELLRAKARELEDCKLPASRGGERGAPADPRGRALSVALGTVLRHAARLHHLLGAPSTHPCTVHAALSELASELGLFSAGGAPPPAAWDHADPGPAYLEARARISGLLEALSPGPALNLMFRRAGDRFECDLPALPEGETGFWLAVRTDLRSEQAKLAVPGGARLASPSRMAGLVAAGLPGVGLTPVRDAPGGLHRRPDTVHFAVRTGDPLWEEALAEKRLEVRWDGAPARVQLMLVAVRS